MHVELRKVGVRPDWCSPVWFFRWGVGFWVGRTLFGFGHDTRNTRVTSGGR